MADEKTTAVVMLEQVTTGLEAFKTTLAENRARVDRALLDGRKIQLAQGAEFIDDAQDKLANDWLVKARLTLDGTKEKPGVKPKRLSSTKVFDLAKQIAMEPEKELEAEMLRVKQLRDSLQTFRAEEARRKQEAIDKQKNYELYRNKIKGDMQRKYMLEVQGKLTSLDNAIAKMFEEATVDTVDGLEAKLNIKPGLKPEAFRAMLQVEYDNNLMTVEQYTELHAKAYDFFNFDKVNTVYIDMATKTIQGWRDKIPGRRSMLKQAAAGGTQGAQAQARIEADNAQVQRDREVQQQHERQAIEMKVQEEEAKDNLESEFVAQAQSQEIEEPDGREIKVASLAPSVEADFMRLSQVIGKLCVNVFSEKTKDGKYRFPIFKKDKDGYPKTDVHGRGILIDEIQGLLDMYAKLPYAASNLIPGVLIEKKVVTSATVK